MHTAQINGKNMSYLDVGEGPVVLFGHSYLWDCDMWRPQIEVLSKKYRCIVPELWAHGQSEDAPETTTSLIDYADDILLLMDSLDIEQFALVGLSVGGMWGTELALKAPGRVNALVLMDTFIGYEPEVAKEKYFAMFDTIEQMGMIPPSMVDTITPLFFANDAETANPGLVSAFKDKLTSLNGESAKNIVKVGRMVFDRRDTFDDIEKLTIPTLILVGAEDKPRPPLESMLMHDAIDGSEYKVIPNAGHISNLEQADVVTQALTDFLSRYL
ncbi:2-succinyl-6-hydroxy-2,4-cyclohexadiene-1-carboxylate synthase [Grimontia hollisae]|uniref:Beta-ketoadipate enol-lactone hydrolase n=2 Tax=Grimontia hollisae TaxID=673 RepID=D0I5D6_GRIHO|nr:alpha/beta fold hydrolase [Grimontia hollisae]AMG29278.1 2-succinyl-6-hydroxy-2,4-cyclohexadiene-1-carboxylate synthase [Grimontia hollisae]EEY73100.1 beta-ketoadipate enol-lactone hydrolase [Grimontia hollisae CIP 101886]MDF2183902.1 alpha/beta fold hydrolase [Grimontia hollisae]STO77802.1 Arylesterase [Grimontia hollisae]STO98671.1 Arylesterase [Grimontia hollisae]